MRFPRDEGAHPDFRIEWWYITGWLNEGTNPLGFQVTFFRARPDLKHDNPSAFAPRQILIAHAALSDPAAGRLVHLDYAQMSAAIHRFAGVIEALGIAPGERLMVLLPRVPEWQIATLGSLAAGIVAIPTSMAVLSPRDIEFHADQIDRDFLRDQRRAYSKEG